MPGLLVATPSTPADAKGLLKAAIRDDNPVIFTSTSRSTDSAARSRTTRTTYSASGARRAPRGQGCNDRRDLAHGDHGRARRAASGGGARCARRGDRPAYAAPLDLDTILGSVAKTNRCVVVEEGWPHGGVGANLSALISEQAFDDLDAPVRRVTGADVPMPYSKPLEDIAYPHEPQIVDAALRSWASRERRSADGGDRDAASVGHDGGGDDPALAEARRRDVARGEELVEIETDKAAMVYESDEEGTLRIDVGEGETLAVGATIAHVGETTRSTEASSTEPDDLQAPSVTGVTKSSASAAPGAPAPPAVPAVPAVPDAPAPRQPPAPHQPRHPPAAQRPRAPRKRRAKSESGHPRSRGESPKSTVSTYMALRAVDLEDGS